MKKSANFSKSTKLRKKSLKRLTKSINSSCSHIISSHKEISEAKFVEIKRIRCERCGYEWDTESQLSYVTCPNCRSSIKIREVQWLNEKPSKPLVVPPNKTTVDKLAEFGRQPLFGRPDAIDRVGKFGKKRRSSKSDTYDKISNFRI